MNALQLKPTGGKESPPEIEIPDNAWKESGSVEFAIKTSAGAVKVVDTYGHNIQFRGAAEALAALGLYRPEWAPNPANVTNKMKQTILFTDNGPALVVGRFLREQNYEGYSFLTVIRSGAKFYVEMPMSAEQRRIHDERWESWRKKNERPIARQNAEDDGEGHDEADFVPDVTADGLQIARIHLAGVHLDKIKEQVSPQFGLAYTAASEARILRAISELHRAFAEARMVQIVPKYEQQGNVIGWPGRGHIQPVSPAALLQ
jgi:hypothetical protein